MKTVATFLAVSALLAVVSATGGYGGSSGGYGGASIPSPPCPNNYVFSCQANVAPVPCANGYGSAGAYSENVPTVVNPPYGYQGVPQNLLHQIPPLFGQNAATH